MAEDEIETLEKGLLSPETSKNGYGNGDGDGDDESSVIYTASFEESEENFVKYQTVQWILYSLLFLLAWGAGLLMLLYLPVRRFVLRKDVRSRKLYVTRNAIVYKVTRPVAIPCFGVSKKEKHVLLPSVADIVIEQGYLQSFFGVYSVRIENAGVRRPASDHLQIQGITNPNAFRKAVLSYLSNLRSEAFSGQVSAIEGAPSLAGVNPRVTAMTPSKPFNYGAIPSNDFEILQKLDEVETSVKRVEKVIEEQRLQAYIQIGQGDS